MRTEYQWQRSRPALRGVVCGRLAAVDYLVFWPAFHRQSQADPARARTRLWSGAIGYAWALVAVGAALWVANDRSWTTFGFSVPDGWRLWTSIALFLPLAAYHVYAVATVARSSDAQASIRQQSENSPPSCRTRGQNCIGSSGCR